ncbi:MAG: hypothetical protein KF764_30130 [Labilithrix sp.]|nr:hypothetical protein [Labilithrix sp.]MBX3220512.1 hypothetical protein [Labilithrix sp.]
MRAVLADEREGILRFDAVLMARANDAKEIVLQRLRETPAAERGPLLAALDELQPDLRCNQILLAHAQAYLKDMRQAALERERRESSIVPLIRRKAG